MAAAVLVSVAMQLSLPDRHVLSPSVLFPTVEVLLLVVLVIGDPAGGPSIPVLTRVTVGLVIVMTVDNLAGVAGARPGHPGGSRPGQRHRAAGHGGALWRT